MRIASDADVALCQPSAINCSSARPMSSDGLLSTDAEYGFQFAAGSLRLAAVVRLARS